MGARGPSAPHPCPRPGLRFQAATPAQFAQFAEKPPGKVSSSSAFLQGAGWFWAPPVSGELPLTVPHPLGPPRLIPG